MKRTTIPVISLLLLACCCIFIALPAAAFTANSLDISIEKNGDAVATFRFTLEGIIENAIPQSVLEEKLTQGLSTGSEPPQLRSMDRSTAVILLKKFADTSDVPTGTNYLTATMDFKKAEIALQNSGLSGAVTADFSPETVTLNFPDGYQRKFFNVDVLPAVAHVVIDPSKTPQPTAAVTLAPGETAAPQGTTTPLVFPSDGGTMNVSSSPEGVQVYLDAKFIGEAPSLFPEIAPGVHIAEFRKDGYESVKKNVTILKGRTTNVLVALRYISSADTVNEDASSFPLVPALVVLAGLVVIGVGGYYYWNERTPTAKPAPAAGTVTEPAPAPEPVQDERESE